MFFSYSHTDKLASLEALIFNDKAKDISYNYIDDNLRPQNVCQLYTVHVL